MASGHLGSTDGREGGGAGETDGRKPPIMNNHTYSLLYTGTAFYVILFANLIENTIATLSFIFL